MLEISNAEIGTWSTFHLNHRTLLYPMSGALAATLRAKILSRHPLLIRNCIQLVLKLGLGYLWVDRYCIDQSSYADKHDQIQKMDIIYANANLTILAAAGKDPSFGLPGFGGRSRKQQAQLQVGNHLIAATLPETQHSLSKTKRATRAWTYQEGLLSNRRLIFTVDQVAFECNSMHCRESVILPLDMMHTKDGMRFQRQAPGEFS